MTVYIYDDTGVSGVYRDEMLKALVKTDYPLALIDAKTLALTTWQERCVCLVFPGGRDQEYHKKLKGLPNAHIRSYVLSGGRYLGFCAGAYYACEEIQFEKGTDLEVTGKRELGFYRGLGTGSIHPWPYKYEESEGMQTVDLLTPKGTLKTMYHGGCVFSGDKGAEILATYSGKHAGGKPAIVACKVQKGLAVLSSVHPEFSLQALKKVCPAVAAQLKSSDRGDLLNLILGRAGLVEQKQM